MNISLKCDNKIYNFNLPNNISLKYIKKLCNKLYKCEELDIYYNNEKLMDKYKEEDLLINIVNYNDSVIKLKILLHNNFNLRRNKTQLSNNSNTSNIKEPLKNIINENIDKKPGIKNLINLNKNKLFETLYIQKSKKLISLIKEFSNKIIQIDNFLFEKNLSKNNYLNFEKRLYKFVEGLILYYNKLIIILERNNNMTYNELIKNLELLYQEFLFDEENEKEIEFKKDKKNKNINNLSGNCNIIPEDESIIINSSKNLFPINLKRSEKKNYLNSEDSNLFNKKSKISSIKSVLLLSNKNLKNNDSKISYLNKNINNIFDLEQKDSKSSKNLINLTDRGIKVDSRLSKIRNLKITETYSEEKYKNNNIIMPKDSKEKDELSKSDKEEENKTKELSTIKDFRSSDDNNKNIDDKTDKEVKSIKSNKSYKSNESNEYNKNFIRKKGKEYNLNNFIKIKISDISDKLNIINSKNSFAFNSDTNNEKENKIINNEDNNSDLIEKEINLNEKRKESINPINAPKHKLTFHSLTNENEAEDKNEVKNNLDKKDKNMKNEKEDDKKEEDKKIGKNNIDDVIENLTPKKRESFKDNNNLFQKTSNIKEISNKEDDEIGEIKNKVKPSIYYMSNDSLDIARNINKKNLTKRTKNKTNNKFDFLI